MLFFEKLKCLFVLFCLSINQICPLITKLEQFQLNSISQQSRSYKGQGHTWKIKMSVLPSVLLSKYNSNLTINNKVIVI